MLQLEQYVIIRVLLMFGTESAATSATSGRLCTDLKSVLRSIISRNTSMVGIYCIRQLR